MSGRFIFRSADRQEGRNKNLDLQSVRSAPSIDRADGGNTREGRISGACRALGARPQADTASIVVLMFSIGTVVSAVVQRHLLQASQAERQLVELSIGEIFGLTAIVSILFSRSCECNKLCRSDIVVLLIASFAWLVPQQEGIYLSTTLGGIWILLVRRYDRQLLGIAQVWLALSIYELWGKIFFKLTYQMIGAIEVALIYDVGRLFFNGLGVDGASLRIRGDWAIVVLEGCSSFHNLSLTMLIWISILKIADQTVSGAAFRALGTSACLVVAINVARILAMLPSYESYLFWHNDAGSSLVGLASIISAVAPILVCVLATESRTCQRNI